MDKKKRYLTKYVNFKFTLENCITFLIFAPIILFLIGGALMGREAWEKVDCFSVENFAFAFDFLGKGCAIVIPIIILISALFAVQYSGNIILGEKSILYYKWIFSKKPIEISYQSITECLISNGRIADISNVWLGVSFFYRNGIYFFNKSKKIEQFQLNPNLILELLAILPSEKVNFIGINGFRATINDYYHIDFYQLSKKEQLILIKNYCKMPSNKETDADKLLKKYRRKIEKRTRSF